EQDVVAGATVECQRRDARGNRAAVDDVRTGRALHDDAIAGFGGRDPHLRAEATDEHVRAAGAERDVVGAGATVHRHRVVRRVAGRGGGRRGEIDAHAARVGAAQITHVDVVGAPQCVEIEALDVVQVHGDVGDVPEKAHAPAVGR